MSKKRKFKKCHECGDIEKELKEYETGFEHCSNCGYDFCIACLIESNQGPGCPECSDIVAI